MINGIKKERLLEIENSQHEITLTPEEKDFFISYLKRNEFLEQENNELRDKYISLKEEFDTMRLLHDDKDIRYQKIDSPLGRLASKELLEEKNTTMSEPTMFLIQTAHFDRKNNCLTIKAEESQLIYCPVEKLKYVIDNLDDLIKNAVGDFTARIALNLETGKHVDNTEVFGDE